MGRFLIATLATSTGATVRLYEIAAGLNIADVVTAYEVETSTGYLAVLSACLRDECGIARHLGDTAPLIVCTRPIVKGHKHSGQSVDDWLKHLRTHCHGWHEVSARAFAEKVVKTYGSARSHAIVQV
jgi:hypothetical protein